ncbi:DUF2239 family protein [Ferrovibrio sp.]|uniref:DUF2239 family protein n=1 Tax=Ferrovibrio sp. TaxID=1917215 RepID=UPI003D0C76B0
MTGPVFCTAFTADRLLAAGPLPNVALAVKAALAADPAQRILVFDDASGAPIDFDLRGSDAEIAARLAPAEAKEVEPRGRGRPKLGVVAREITLLPRHWEWLGAQPGGASQALRRLIDQARKADEGRTEARARRDAAYRFMSAMAGNLPGFEEAARAFFADDTARFEQHSAAWPLDIRTHLRKLVQRQESSD